MKLIILNSLSGGEMFERVAEDDARMSEQLAANYIKQVCEGVRHMHEKGIVHLDIKVFWNCTFVFSSNKFC